MKCPIRRLVLLLALTGCGSPTIEQTDSPPTPAPSPTPQPEPTVDPNPAYMVGTWVANRDYTIDDGVGYHSLTVDQGLPSEHVEWVADQLGGVDHGRVTSKILSTRMFLNANGTGHIDSLRQTQTYSPPTNPSVADYLNEENAKIGGEFPRWYEKTVNDFTWSYVDGVLSIKNLASGGFGFLPLSANDDSYVDSDLWNDAMSKGVPVQLPDFHVTLNNSLVPGDWHNTVKTPRPYMEDVFIYDISGAFTVTGNTATTELLSFFTRQTLTFVRQ